MIQDPDPDVDVELEKFFDWMATKDNAHRPFSLSFEKMKAIWIFGKAGHDAWNKAFQAKRTKAESNQT